MRVQSLKKFSVAASSRFAGDMCRVGWAVPARSAEGSTVYQRCNDMGTRERKTERWGEEGLGPSITNAMGSQ